MDDKLERIAKWSEAVKAYRSEEWERLPELYLYMDQVLTYMGKQLSLFERDESTSLLSSSMINNYVKNGVLPRPEQKKYGRTHLALLTVICLLKQVLSLQDIQALLDTLSKEGPEHELYEQFCTSQGAASAEVCARVDEALPEGEAALTRLAMELSIEASARRAAAERILSELKEPPPPKKGK